MKERRPRYLFLLAAASSRVDDNELLKSGTIGTGRRIARSVGDFARARWKALRSHIEKCPQYHALFAPKRSISA